MTPSIDLERYAAAAFLLAMAAAADRPTAEVLMRAAMDIVRGQHVAAFHDGDLHPYAGIVAEMKEGTWTP
jgi:hypothetical protein